MPQAEVPVEDYTWWYVTLFVLVSGLGAAIFWLLNSQKAEEALKTKQNKKSEIKNAQADALDFDKELEWLRKNQKIVNRNQKTKVKTQKAKKDKPSRVKAGSSKNGASGSEASDTLPIFTIEELEPASSFETWSISDDDDLMTAIEQVYEEFEEDEQIRELAVKILAMFKTRNSVDALAHVALQDESANLRSKAVGVLAEFDHESVFEAILLACADPAREVRAAAARGLFRLNFDRAAAWTRLSETKDEEKLQRSAKAAIEADLVERSFERLIHPDMKYAYEAFALVALLLKAGEIEVIFTTLKKHKDINVQKAILHVIGVIKNPLVLENLDDLVENKDLSAELRKEVEATIKKLDPVEA